MTIIKQLRQYYGFTQAAFADYFGIPKRTIESWESESQSASRRCPSYLVDLIIYKLSHEFPDIKNWPLRRSFFSSARRQASFSERRAEKSGEGRSFPACKGFDRVPLCFGLCKVSLASIWLFQVVQQQGVLPCFPPRKDNRAPFLAHSVSSKTLYIKHSNVLALSGLYVCLAPLV